MLTLVESKKRILVVMGNPLIEAHYKLGEIEQKLLRFLISKIQPESITFQKYYYRISIREFEKFLGRKEVKHIHQQMRTLALRLKNASLRTILPNGNLLETSWITSFEYPPGRGWIEFEFSSKLESQLLALKEQFTQYYFQNISKLKGEHTIRIYELVKQYLNSDEKSRIIELDELKNILGLKTEYRFIGNLKQRVLLPSHREICTKADITFKYRPVKESRKIVAIEFYDIRQKKTTTVKEEKIILKAVIF